MLNPTNSNTTQIDVAPTDLGQSLFRVGLVSIIVIWTYLRYERQVTAPESVSGQLQFALIYLILSIAILIWTYALIRQKPPHSLLVRGTRIASVFTDIGAVSIYIAISGEHGIVLYPIFLTSSIGYGYRFGISYLFFALTLSVIGFTVAQAYNEYLANSPNLIAAFYLGIIAVPLYAANLLKRHRQVLKRMQILDSARSRFIANMSHELRTPLHAIMSVTDILAAEKYSSVKNSDDYTTKLRIIRDSGHHLLKLVNRILDVASADAAGVRGEHRSVISLVETVLSGIRICQPTAESKGLKYLWYFDLSLPQYIVSSAEYLEEIIINTVGNAAKYTSCGHIFTSVTTRLDEDIAYLSLEVNDTGIGIHPKLLPTIFEPFTLGDDRTSRRYSGTGLGLTLTKQFVEHLGGKILIESEVDVGTRCEILLPIISVESDSTTRTESQARVLNGLFVSSMKNPEYALLRFAESGWNCIAISSCHLISRSDCPNIAGIFVDQSLGAQLSTTIQQARELLPQVPVYFCGDSRSINPMEMQINSALSLESPDSIKMARALSLAATTVQLDPDDIQKTNPARARRILVADDNATNLKAARFALESRGHETTLVCSGDSALAELEAGDYDLAVIDLHMPDMSGIEVSQIYQYLFVEHRTPVIILTADATGEAESEARRAGAIAVLQKPLHVSQLLAAVDQYATGNAPRNGINGNKKDDKDPNMDVANLIDVSVLIELINLGVSRIDLEDMLTIFLDETEALVRDIVRAYREGRDAELRGALHSVQGACGTMGAIALSARAGHLSCVIDELTGETINEKAHELEMLLRDSVKRMREVIEVEYDHHNSAINN